MKFHYLVCAVCLGAVLLSAGSARAQYIFEQEKSYAGSFCREEGDYRPEIIYDKKGRATNLNAVYDSRFVCPAIGHLNGTYVEYISGEELVDPNPLYHATAEVMIQNNSEEPCCSLFAMEDTGESLVMHESKRVCAEPTRSGVSRIVLELEPWRLYATAAPPVLFLRCFVPRREAGVSAGIVGYTVSERLEDLP